MYLFYRERSAQLHVLSSQGIVYRCRRQAKGRISAVAAVSAFCLAAAVRIDPVSASALRKYRNTE